MPTEAVAQASPIAEISVPREGTGNPEFYDRCCTELGRLPAVTAAPGDRLGGMKAILTRADLMWENGIVRPLGSRSRPPLTS